MTAPTTAFSSSEENAYDYIVVGAGSAGCLLAQKRGRRWSAAPAFLKPVLGRPNLTLRTGVDVERLILDGRKAVGAAYRDASGAYHATLRDGGEVVLQPALLALRPCWSVPASGMAIGSAAPASSRYTSCVASAKTFKTIYRSGLYRVSGIRTLNSDYWNLFRRGMMGLDYALRRRGALTMAPSRPVSAISGRASLSVDA